MLIKKKVESSDRTLRHVLEEGPRIFAYRVWKLGRLFFLNKVGYWDRLNVRMKAFWSPDRIDEWRRSAATDHLFIGPSKLESFKKWISLNPDRGKKIMARAADIEEGRINVFDQEYAFSWNNMPWHTDWRKQHTWDPTYYRTYRYYIRDKESSYDVKFPWELSRFLFLVPLAEASVLTRDPRWRDRIVDCVSDWEKKNPVAYSVNWCAMECAMRGITLSLVTMMLAADADTDRDDLAPLLRQLTLQGKFLFWNIEYTSVRNNHYTANLVALLLMGKTLQDVYGPAAQWVTYAAKRIPEEIELQYCEDGVNFEKSISYHRLVTELFLLGLIALDHSGYCVPERSRFLIHRACEFTKSYTRPDGSVPNLADNDSAQLLGFDCVPLRCHSALLSLAASYFSDGFLSSEVRQSSASVPWLLGEKGFQSSNGFRDRDDRAGSRAFTAGGIFISREGDNHLIADFGEVGLKGQGGHGHNDTFSFELFLAGRPFIVDPGSPAYTGDLELYDLYRSTGYHNTVEVDGQEMARLLATWKISNEAAPENVHYVTSAEVDTVEGEHFGYSRLDDPVVHKRVITFYKREGRLICRDLFRCSGKHHIKRFLYFAPGIDVRADEKGLNIPLEKNKSVHIRWAESSRMRLKNTQVSENYGHLVDSRALVLEDDIEGNGELSFEVSLRKG